MNTIQKLREINPSVKSINAPSELKAKPNWVVWRYEHVPNKEKPLKVPYYIDGRRRQGTLGSEQDRSNLATFASAIQYAAANNYDGVGFAPMPEDNYTILDFDGCVNGKVHDQVVNLIAGTYAEFSPSGTGVRAIMRGRLKNMNKKAHGPWPFGFEAYSQHQYLTFTGNTLDITQLLGNEETIADLTPELISYYNERSLYSAGTADPDERHNAGHLEPPLGVPLPYTQDMLSCLPDDLEYDDWLNVGFAMHHEYDGSDDAFEAWLEWSRSSPKHSTDEYVRRRWESFGQNEASDYTTIRTVARYAKQNGHYFDLDAAVPDELDEFDDMDSQQAPTSPKDKATSRFELIPAHEYAVVKPTQWLIRDLIPQAEVGSIFGESTAGKSFFILDVALHIATGRAWRGRPVKQQPVVYIAAEGANGVRKRLVAFAKHHNVDLRQAQLQVIAAAPNMLDRNEVKDIKRAIVDSGQPALIILDTLAQSMPGGNENSSEDMGRVLHGAKQLAKATRSQVLIVHHAGKDQSKGARGWSGLRAAMDYEIQVTRDEDLRLAKLTKQKDDADGLVFPFELTPVVVGTDDEGEDIVSCVVSETELVQKVARPTSRQESRKQLGETKAKYIMEAFDELEAQSPDGIVMEADLKEKYKQNIADLLGTKGKEGRDWGFIRASDLVDLSRPRSRKKNTYITLANDCGTAENRAFRCAFSAVHDELDGLV